MVNNIFVAEVTFKWVRRFVLVILFLIFIYDAAGIHMFKVKNVNNRTTCEGCSELTMKTPELGQWRLCDVLSDVFLINLK